MKLSEVSLSIVKDFCGTSGSDSGSLFQVFMASARAKILAETGLTAEQADECEDLTLAFLVLVNEAFTTRTNTIEGSTLNPMVEQILSAHHRNYVG